MPYVPTDLVSFVPGTYTPGAETAAHSAVAMANGTWNIALEQVYNAGVKADALANADTGYLATHAPADIVAGSVTSTPATEPSITLVDLSASTVSTEIGAQSGAITSAMVAAFATFMSTWFPAEGGSYAAYEAYVTTKLTNTTSGAIPAGVQAAILATAKAKIASAQVQAVADANEYWAAKRHKRPTGAQAGQVRRIVQTALNATSDAVREIAIKDFDLAHQGAMEAAKLAVANRGQALEAARQFIVASITQAYTSGSQVAQVARDAEAKAKATAYAAFSARISAAEMALKATIADQGLQMEAAKANLAAELQMIEANVKTFANELQGLIAVAVAFANNARTGSSMAYSVNGT